MHDWGIVRPDYEPFMYEHKWGLIDAVAHHPGHNYAMHCTIHRSLCAIVYVALLSIKQFKDHITYNSTQQVATQMLFLESYTPCFRGGRFLAAIEINNICAIFGIHEVLHLVGGATDRVSFELVRGSLELGHGRDTIILFHTSDYSSICR